MGVIIRNWKEEKFRGSFEEEIFTLAVEFVGWGILNIFQAFFKQIKYIPNFR